MGITIREIQGLTDDWTDAGREARVLADLWATSEVEALRALTQVVYRLRASQLAAEVETVLNAAQAELERLALVRDKAVAEVRTIEADLDAAETALAQVGPDYREREFSPEKSAVSKLTRAYREAGEAMRDAGREYWTADKKVDVLAKVLTALRSVHPADATILAALAEALGIG